MKRSTLLVGTIFFALIGLLFIVNLFVILPAEAAQVVPDFPQAITAPPEITNLYPIYGYNDTTTFLSIDGLNFVTDTAVYLDATQLMTVSVFSSTFLEAQVPPGLPLDSYDVRLVNPDSTEGVWADAYSVLLPITPTITAVSPNKGPNNLPLTIDIYGKNFHEGSWATLLPGFFDLGALYYVDSSHLKAIIPQNIPTGVYTLEVSTSNEMFTSQLPNAYEAFDPDLNTDLFAGEYGLWRQPLTIRMGDPITPVIGLNVRRQGGFTDTVPVDFYMDAPSAAAGGTWIGQSTTPPLPPNSMLSTLPLEWVPPGIGNVTIFAVIDPTDQTFEVDETNNIISRTIKVLPPLLGDTVSPVVTGFRINNGAVKTNNRHVVLDTTAVDNIGGSGVESILFAEFAYVQSAGTWLPVRVSDWLPFAEASINHPTVLVASPGLHFFKVWVADKVGNVSAPATSFINFQPASAYISDGEVHVYRMPTQVGVNWQVQLTMEYGIADVYVWDPNSGLVDIRENVTLSQTIDFTAAQTGVYQIEVEGQGSASYQLQMRPTAGLGGVPPLDFAGPLAVNGRAQPFVSVAEEPGDDVGLSDPPSTYYTVMLPVVIKN